jgi:hypothetical protein
MHLKRYGGFAVRRGSQGVHIVDWYGRDRKLDWELCSHVSIALVYLQQGKGYLHSTILQLP